MEGIDYGRIWEGLTLFGAIAFMAALVRYIRAPVQDWEKLNRERTEENRQLKEEISLLREEIVKLRDDLAGERWERQKLQVEIDGLRRQEAQKAISQARVEPKDD